MKQTPEPIVISEGRVGLRAAWSLWLLWVAATTLGYMTAVLAHWSITRYGVSDSLQETAALAAGALAGSTVIGIVQGIAIQRLARIARWFRWWAVTVLGYLAGLAFVALLYLLATWLASHATEPGPVPDTVQPGRVLASICGTIIVFAIAGGILGVLQLQVLRKHVGTAFSWQVTLWLIANGIHMILGIVGILLVIDSGRTITLGDTSRTPGDLAPGLIPGALLIGFICGAITATAFVLLIRSCTRRPQSLTNH